MRVTPMYPYKFGVALCGITLETAALSLLLVGHFWSIRKGRIGAVLAVTGELKFSIAKELKFSNTIC